MDNNNDDDTLVQQPPLGLMPRWLHSEIRIDEIKSAMYRYKIVKKEIPIEWIKELEELEEWLRKYHLSDKEGIKF